MDREYSPRVSVLMAVHNGERHLAEALDSVLAQTLADFELVVVDDASTDGTADMLDAYAERDGRVVVIRNAENLRLPASLNRGLAHCRAPLVARADADDVNLPERLERQAAFLDRHLDVGVVGCAFRKMDEAGHLLNTVRYATDHEAIRARQLFLSSFLHPGVVFRASVVRAVGGYDEAYWTAQDSDLWTRLRDRTRFANLPDVLVHYRVHGDSIVRTRGDEGQRLSICATRRPLEEILGHPLGDDELEAVVLLYRGFHPVESAGVSLGLPLLRQVLGRVRKTESHAVSRAMRREAAASLLRQVWSHSRLDKPSRRVLLVEAARLDPRLIISRRMLRSVSRAI